MNAKGQVSDQWFVHETTPVRHPIILTCDKFQEMGSVNTFLITPEFFIVSFVFIALTVTCQTASAASLYYIPQSQKRVFFPLYF